MVRIACLLLALSCAGVARAATVTGDPAAGTITLAGQIVPGDFERFQKAAAPFGERKDVTVVLSGPGGKMMEGLKVGIRIHEHGWSTRVEDGRICLSTCAMIWLAGHERVASSDAHIGFHAPFDVRTEKVSDVGIHVVGTYCDVLGLGERTAEAIVFKKPGEGMTWLDPDEAVAMGVTMTVVPTRTRGNGRFSTAALDEQDEETAHFKEGGTAALRADIDACYAAYAHRRVDAVGFRCFFLEVLSMELVKAKAEKEGHRPDPHFALKTAAGRIVHALLATGHTRRRALALLASWQADLKATARADP